MNRSLALIIVFVCQNLLYAQQPVTLIPELDPDRYIGISINPFYSQKSKIDGAGGRYHFDSYSPLGVEALISYYRQLNGNNALTLSTGVNAIQSSFEYSIAKEDFDPPTLADISDSRTASSSVYFQAKVQGEFEHQWRKKQSKQFWIIAAGGSVLYSPDEPDEIYGYIRYGFNSPTNSFYRLDQDISHNKKPWINLYIALGHEWIIRSKNILQAKIKLTYSPSPFLKGTYDFHPGNGPELKGTYKTSGSWLGIGACYLFRLKRKQLSEK